MADARLKITLVRSLIACRPEHRATVRGLGLRRLHHSVVRADDAAIRGMLRQVGYLVRVEAAA